MLRERINFINKKVPINIGIYEIGFYPIHYHNCLEIILVLDGKVKIKDGYWYNELIKGDMQVIDEGALHSIESVNGKSHILLFQINTNYFSNSFPNIHSTFFVLDTKNPSEAEITALEEFKSLLLTLCFDAFFKPNQDVESMLNKIQRLINLLYEHFQYFCLEDNEWVNQIKNKENPILVERLHSIRSYIYENYYRKLTLEEISSREYLSPTYLSHIIKKTTQMSFQDFLNMVRAEKSETFLLDTNKKIGEISLECGFSAIRYYKNHFIKWYNIDPEEYREKCKSNKLTLNYCEPPKLMNMEKSSKIINAFIQREEIAIIDSISQTIEVCNTQEVNNNKNDAAIYRKFLEFRCNFKYNRQYTHHIKRFVNSFGSIVKEINIEINGSELSNETKAELYCLQLIEFINVLKSLSITPIIVLLSPTENHFNLIKYIGNKRDIINIENLKFKLAVDNNKDDMIELEKALISQIHDINIEFIYNSLTDSELVFNQAISENCDFELPFLLHKIFNATHKEVKVQINLFESNLEEDDFFTVSLLDNGRLDFTNHLLLIMSHLSGKEIEKGTNYIIFYSKTQTQILLHNVDYHYLLSNGNNSVKATETQVQEYEYNFKIECNNRKYFLKRYKFSYNDVVSLFIEKEKQGSKLSNSDKLSLRIALQPKIKLEIGSNSCINTILKSSDPVVELIQIDWL